MRPSGITPDFHAAFKQTWYKAWNTGRAASCPDMAAAVRQGDQRDRRSSATGNYTHSVRDSLPGIPLLTRGLLTLCLYKSKWRAMTSDPQLMTTRST